MHQAKTESKNHHFLIMTVDLFAVAMWDMFPRDRGYQVVYSLNELHPPPKHTHTHTHTPKVYNYKTKCAPALEKLGPCSSEA